jgi:hypothetical protein
MALHRPDSAFRPIAALHAHSHTRGDAGHLAAESWIKFPVRSPPAPFEFLLLILTTLHNHPAASNHEGENNSKTRIDIHTQLPLMCLGASATEL